MGSEFADREKRPEHQPDFYQREQSKSQESWAQQIPPQNTQQPLLINQPKLRAVPVSADNPNVIRLEGLTPEYIARIKATVAADPGQSWLAEPDGKPSTPAELFKMRQTPDNIARIKAAMAADPAQSWLTEPDGKPPTPEEIFYKRRDQRLAAQSQNLQQQGRSPEPEEKAPEEPKVSQQRPQTILPGNGIGGSGTLIAQSVALPLGVPQGMPMPNPLPGMGNVLKNAAPFIKGVGGAVGGAILEGVFAQPTVSAEDEARGLRKPNPVAPTTSQPSVPTTVSPPAPAQPEEIKQVPLNRSQEERKSQSSPMDKQEAQWEKARRDWDAKFNAEQSAQQQLWKAEDRLTQFSDGFLLKESEVEDFAQQLRRTKPEEFKQTMQAANVRYEKLATLAKQAGNPYAEFEVKNLQQKLLNQVLYERYIPVREIYHFSNKFMNGYSPEKMQTVRGYFDRVFEGTYSKGIPEGKRGAIEANADEKYLEETGKQEVDRNSLLWKTLRNIEASERFPDLWDRFQDDLNNGGVSKTVVEQPRDAKDNVLTSPVGSAPKKPSHTGHGTPEKVETGTKPFGEGVQPKTPDNTAHDGNEKAAVTNVFEWSTDYRKNYEKAYGVIPAGHQIHHIAPRAVFNKNALTQEWVRRGMTKLDYPENLQALPQTKYAYDKSNIKIQHSGSHSEWSDHVADVLEKEQKRLTKQYGSLDKVPDDVMEQRKDKIMKQLRDDLLDKDLGLDEGWVIPKDSGMDKLSQSQSIEQLG
jgi:hypothetical protein